MMNKKHNLFHSHDTYQNTAVCIMIYRKWNAAVSTLGEQAKKGENML